MPRLTCGGSRICLQILPVGSSLPVFPCLSLMFLLLLYLALLLKEIAVPCPVCFSGFVCGEFRSFPQVTYTLFVAVNLYLFDTYFKNWCFVHFSKDTEETVMPG